jgi:hypothetical protein
MKEEKSLGDRFIDALDGHKCDDCEEYKDDVEYVICPYDADIYDKETWCWLCDECYRQRADAI